MRDKTRLNMAYKEILKDGCLNEHRLEFSTKMYKNDIVVNPGKKVLRIDKDLVLREEPSLIKKIINQSLELSRGSEYMAGKYENNVVIVQKIVIREGALL